MTYKPFRQLRGVDEETSKERRKQLAILNNICKDCDRQGKIRRDFCADCWNEMDKTINKVQE